MKGKRKVVSPKHPFSHSTGKRVGQTNDLTRNPGIPVLTDIMPLPEKKHPPQPARTTSQPTLLPDEKHWDELEERLNRRIHKQLTERISFVLDENLEQHVSTILKQVITLLSNEIKHDLQKTLDVMITHAVSTELERLKTAHLAKDNSRLSGK